MIARQEKRGLLSAKFASPFSIPSAPLLCFYFFSVSTREKTHRNGHDGEQRKDRRGGFGPGGEAAMHHSSSTSSFFFFFFERGRKLFFL